MKCLIPIGKDYGGGVKRPNVTDARGTTAAISWEVRWWLSHVTKDFNFLGYRTTPFLTTVVFRSTIKFCIVLWVYHIIITSQLFLDFQVKSL